MKKNDLTVKYQNANGAAIGEESLTDIPEQYQLGVKVGYKNCIGIDGATTEPHTKPMAVTQPQNTTKESPSLTTVPFFKRTSTKWGIGIASAVVIIASATVFYYKKIKKK